MSKAKIKTLVPELRFPEFRDAEEWEEKQFGETCKFIRGPFGGSLKKEMFVKDGYAVYEQSHAIHQNYDSFRYYITKEKFNELKRFSVYPNDIIMSCSGTMGKFSIIPDKAKSGVINQALLKLTVNPELNINFIKTTMELSSNQEKLLSQSAGGAIKNIVSVSQIKEIGLYIPPLSEQQKIADCLSSIDELIVAHTQKYEALKAHKKGLMQQLFPAKGETVPKLRFSEFQNSMAWAIKPLSSLLTIGNGKDYKHLSSGNIPVYGSGGYMLSVDKHLYDGESACIGRKGTINKPMFLSGKFWTVDTLFYTHSFKDCSPKFVYLIFQNINWLSHNEAGGVPSLSKTNINRVEVATPSPAEQNRIVECIFSTDDLINTQSQKIESLKTHKKGLMQQLFPVVDEVNT